MPQIKEIAKIKSNDFFIIEQMVKDVGITKSLLCELVGISQGAFYRIFREKDEKALENYLDAIINVLAGLTSIKGGTKVVPKVNPGKVPGAEKIHRLKAEDTERIEEIRKDLGITQEFLGECSGTTGANYSFMISQSGKIVDKYFESMKNALEGIFYLQQGYDVAPASSTDNGTEPKKAEKEPEKKEPVDEGKEQTEEELDSIQELLEDIRDPKVSIFSNSDKETILTELLKDFSERADKLYKKLYTNE